jgi:hypothetical protein
MNDISKTAKDMYKDLKYLTIYLNKAKFKIGHAKIYVDGFSILVTYDVGMTTLSYYKGRILSFSNILQLLLWIIVYE